MANKRSRYTEDFKLDLIKQVLIGDKSPAEVSASSGVEISSIYDWIRKYKTAMNSEPNVS